ncbi:hypothetical protein ACFWBF_02720 [Streptomyces sp. NPDC060028]|uniref:hypothetical protein n=1 Tax=Streptomyces sp. NPDC060028 TaxID=3347041 RepID=UPI00368DB605
MAVARAEVAAVSRVLNGGHPVAGATRTPVEQAVEDLAHLALPEGRVPLRAAGALAARFVTGRRPLPPGGITMLPAELTERGSAAPQPRPGGSRP